MKTFQKKLSRRKEVTRQERVGHEIKGVSILTDTERVDVVVNETGTKIPRPLPS